MYERINIRSARELDLIRASSRVVAEVLLSAYDWVKPGVTTAELDRKAEELIRKRGGEPSFKGYLGYPATLCTSVNEEVVHGIPSHDRVLEEGDVIGIDVGCFKNGYHGDAARTYAVGQVSEETRALLAAGAEALACGIDAARAGNYIGDIGCAVQSYAEPRGYSVVRDLVGHGIGERLHEAPQVPNYGRRGTLAPIRAGMALAIEPMLNGGGWKVETLDDRWTVVTADRSLSVHFENTIAVTEDGPVILTDLDRV
jgi:methionyl aminopeptidase